MLKQSKPQNNSSLEDMKLLLSEWQSNPDSCPASIALAKDLIKAYSK